LHLKVESIGEKSMKYLPKSKLGAVMSALYLLLVFGLLLGGLLLDAIFGWQRLWGAYMFIFSFLLTLPLSSLPWLLLFSYAIPNINFNKHILPIFPYLLFIMQAVGAFFNAAIIYLVVGFVSRALQSFSKRL
jgi:hypothetical protein